MIDDFACPETFHRLYGLPQAAMARHSHHASLILATKLATPISRGRDRRKDRSGAAQQGIEDNIRLISKYREENEKQKPLQDHLEDIIISWT